MESPDSSPHVSLPERLPHRSGPPRSPSPPPPDGMDKPTYIKFLVSNAEAGSVIGKGGSTITDFQSQTGARIQLSRNHEFFPGTSDRIIMVSGAAFEVIKATELILSKLSSEVYAEGGDDIDQRSKVRRLIVPNSACGGIIGKGGATIKSFIEESQAGIKISPQDNNFYGLSDRLVMLTGSIEEQMRAVDLILSKLSEDPHYSQAMHSPFSYPATYNTMSYGPNVAGRKFQTKEERTNSVTVTIGIADEHIGIVLGRGGRNIVEISQVSGATIRISDRGDFMSGTNDRKVTITGSQRAINTAEDMIMQKVAYASER